jgi:outer membrane receptor for ferric coprogen and ferric-rhodotorulic acid
MPRGYGVVQKSTSKNVKGKNYFGFVLEGEDKLYRTGQINPNLETGAKISFNYEDGEYGSFVDVKTIKAYRKEGASAAPVAGNKDDYWKNKELVDASRQKQISYQAATNTALAITNFAIEKGYLKIGAKDSLKAYTEAVKQLASEVYHLYQTEPFKAPEEPDKAEVEPKGPKEFDLEEPF